MMETTIKQTKDYSKFITIKGNRNINANHVAELALSVLRNNLLAQNPIIVNERMEIIDGQHRFEVAKANNLPIHYIIVPGATIKEVVSLNITNKRWEAKDFLESYAARGNESYVWFKGFIEEYGISITSGLSLVYGADLPISSTALRTGRMSLSEEQRKAAERRADLLFEIRPFINNKGRVPRSFLRALIIIESEGKGKQLADSVKAKARLFRAETGSLKDAMAQVRGLMR